jgi:electron transfer flavoprotein alpha subunit
MKNGENFKLLEELATVLGETAIGASRAAVGKKKK